MEHQRRKMNQYIDAIALFAVIHYAAFRFLQNTTFPFQFSDLYKTVTLLSLGCIGGIRYLYIEKDRFIRSIAEKDIKRLLLYLLCFLMALPFIFVGLKHDLKILVFFPFAALCLYQMKPEKVIIAFILAIGLLLAGTAAACLAGCIRNIALTSGRGAHSYAASYGIWNTTDFAAYFLFISLFVWSNIKTHTWTMCVALLCSFILCSIAVYSLSRSQTTLICFLLLAGFVLWEQIEYSVFRKNSGMNWIIKATNGLATISFPLIMIFFSIMVFLYGSGNAFAVQMNAFLSDRLSDTWKILEKYGVKIWGTAYAMHGNGGTIFLDWRIYDFLDSSYAYLLIRYGIVITCIFTGLWIRTANSAIHSGRKKLAYAMSVMAVYALSESHLSEINYNILVAMPFCSFLAQSEEALCRENRNKSFFPKNCFSILIAFAMICGLFFLSPRLLAVIRSVSYVLKWNSGIKTIWPLLLCMVFMIGLYELWKQLANIYHQKSKKSIVLVTLILLSFALGIFEANQVINNGINEKKEELSAEENVIQIVKKAAKQPVYAFEKWELYNRLIGGFSDTIATAEDLCRSKKGTLFTNSDREVLQIIQDGGMYLQFSDSSSIYTFDMAVVEALSNQNYNWTAFYSSTRKCDLEDIAALNGLELDREGQLLLNGENQSIRKNRLLDLSEGNYEVRYFLQLPQTEHASQICTIRMTAYDGEVTIIERAVDASEFDETGRCEIVLSFKIYDRPKTEFLLEAAEGVQVNVVGIEWEKVS